MPPENICDQTHGEIFVVRVAGNIAGPSEVGSLEYAVEHLRVPLVLVMVTRAVERSRQLWRELKLLVPSAR